MRFARILFRELESCRMRLRAILRRIAKQRAESNSTSNAGCPLTTGQTPLLTCDVWEHAYYIDFRNLRPKYLEAFWVLANWDFASANFAA